MEYQCEICSFKNSSKAIGEQHEKLDHPPQELKNFFTCEKIVSNYWHKNQATMHAPTMCVVKLLPNHLLRTDETLKLLIFASIFKLSNVVQPSTEITCFC